jgi:hypothetical protein
MRREGEEREAYTRDREKRKMGKEGGGRREREK